MPRSHATRVPALPAARAPVNPVPKPATPGPQQCSARLLLCGVSLTARCSPRTSPPRLQGLPACRPGPPPPPSPAAVLHGPRTAHLRWGCRGPAGLGGRPTSGGGVGGGDAAPRLLFRDEASAAASGCPGGEQGGVGWGNLKRGTRMRQQTSGGFVRPESGHKGGRGRLGAGRRSRPRSRRGPGASAEEGDPGGGGQLGPATPRHLGPGRREPRPEGSALYWPFVLASALLIPGPLHPRRRAHVDLDP